MNEFLKLLTESPDNEALVKMLTQGMQGSVKSNDIGGNLLKTGLSTAGTAAFGPIGGVAGTVLGQLLVPNKQEPQPINPRVQRNLNPYGMATGGMVQDGQGLVPVEVEGDEMYELPNGQVGEFQGPDHEQGGIPTQLPPGTNVYSKRMPGADGRSMADRKESRERRLRKILAQLDKRPTDAPTINSVSREVNRIQAEEEQDMQIMQMYQLRDMLAQARQGQMQGQMSPEMMQGQIPQEMMQGEMPMMQAGGVIGNNPNNIYNRVPRKGAMTNPDGSQSTHLMAREYMPDKGWVAFPTLFQNEDESWLDMSNNKNWQDTYKEALNRNEVFEFGDDEQAAIEFADKGNWKQAYQPTFDYPNMVMPRDNTAINMPMMQAGGVIRNGNTMNGFTDLAMLLGGYSKMAAGGTTSMMSDDYINQFANYQLPVMAAGGNVRSMNVMPTEPPKINVEDLILKIVQYEEQQGSENFGNKFTDKKFDSAEDAAEWITKNLLPYVPEKYKSPYEKAAYLDFLYDTQLNPEFYFNYVYYGDNRDDPGKLAEMRAREGSLKKLTLDDVKKGRIFKDKKKDKEWGLSGWQKEQGFKDEDREDGRDYVFEETIDRGNAFNRLRTMNAARFQYYKHHNEEGRRLNERTDADEIATNENLTNNYNRLINTSTPDSIEETPFLDENAPAGSYDFRNVNAIAGQNVFVGEIDKLQEAVDYYNELKSKQKPGEPLSYELKQIRDYLINEIDAYGSMLRPTDQNFIQNNPFVEYNVPGIESVVEQYQGIATGLETEIQGEIDQLIEQGNALDPEKDYGVMQQYKDDINRLRKKFDRINENTTYVTENVIPSYSGEVPATTAPTTTNNTIPPANQAPTAQAPTAQAPAGTQQGQQPAAQAPAAQAPAGTQQGQALPTTQQPTTQAPAETQQGQQPVAQAPPTNQGIDPLAESIATRRSGELSPPSADNVVDNINVGDQAGQANTAPQPNQLREHLRKILEYEKNHGSADGTALPNFGNKAAGKTFKDEEEALDWIMETIVPKIPEGLSTVEQLAWADFLYNTGKDPRVWAVQEYLQKYNPNSKELENGELKGRKDMFIAMDNGTYEGSEDEKRINKLYEDVMALNGKERLKLFNQGRDFYYRNVTPKGVAALDDHPLGAKSNAYQNTWFPRIANSSTLDSYSEEALPKYSEETKDQFNIDVINKKVIQAQAETQDQQPAATENQTATTTEAGGPSFFEERLRLNQDLFEGRRNPSDYEIPFAPPPVEPGFTGYGLDGELMPQTELATGIPKSEVTLNLDPTAQEQALEEALAKLSELDKSGKGYRPSDSILKIDLDKFDKNDEEAVKAVQRELEKQGYDLGRFGVDGKWKGDTQAAYDKWLADNKDRLTQLEDVAGAINRNVTDAGEVAYGLDEFVPPTTPTTPEAEKTEPTWKIDPLTRAGYITSGAGPLITTILNRLGDEPTPNFYANFGRDAERALDAAERGIAGSRDRAYEENRLAQNLRGRQARNAARSSNVMQAMQQAALTSGMKANEQITGQYQNALRALLANRAQFEQGQDQAVMKGREAAYTADLQNRDQFSTNLASNLANAGSMMQTLGRQKEVFDVYNQIGKSGGDATKNTLIDRLMSLYSIGGENKKDTTK